MLPPQTEQVWTFLKEQTALTGFVLVGGSALALRIGHRLSEDLDLAWTQQRLPRARLGALRRLASESSFDFLPQEDEATVQGFSEAGLVLQDYQQDYLVNGLEPTILFFIASFPRQNSSPMDGLCPDQAVIGFNETETLRRQPNPFAASGARLGRFGRVQSRRLVRREKARGVAALSGGGVAAGI